MSHMMRLHQGALWLERYDLIRRLMEQFWKSEGVQNKAKILYL